jgi:hypothetical protein
MSGAIPPLPLYAFMAWCSVKAQKQLCLYLREIGWEGVNWMHLAQDRGQWRAVVNTVINLWVPFKGVEFLD